MSLNTLNSIYNSIIQKCEYVYSNVIGPNNEYFKDIHFLILAKNKEIVFNIISSADNINIICSYIFTLFLGLLGIFVVKSFIV